MIEQGLRGHGKMPDPIVNAPDLFPWLQPYYTAFEELISERREDGYTGDVGLIPWTAIDRYAMRHKHGIGREFGTLLMYLRALDYKHRKLIKDSRPKTPPGGKPGKPGYKPKRPPIRSRQ